MKKKKQKIFKKHITYPNTFNFILYFSADSAFIAHYNSSCASNIQL